MTFQEIRIIATGPCIANQLRDVNTICRRSWYIVAHVWKMYDFKIEVVPFIINFSTELTTVVKFEVCVQKWCGRSCICGFFNFQLWRIYQWKKFCKNCAPLLVDLFLYSYESEFLQKLVKDKKIHEVRAFNFTYRYIDDVLSINNSRFAEFLPLIYPPELEVKETTDTASYASYLDLYLAFDDSGQLSTTIYDKRDDFNF
jgi:hypothetical protein